MTDNSEDDRFDLEQAIMNAWATADDLDLLARNVLEGDDDTDTIVNTLEGLRQLHILRCKRLFDIFESLIEQGVIE